jgi:hypothetical protein
MGARVVEPTMDMDNGRIALIHVLRSPSELLERCWDLISLRGRRRAVL